MYVIRDLKEAKDLLEAALKNSRRLQQQAARENAHSSSTLFYNGEIIAYEHALEIIDGLRFGQQPGALLGENDKANDRKEAENV